MADAQHIYGDGWGEIIDRPPDDLIELRWFDSTATMSKPEFEQWLSTFAERVSRLRRSRILVEATNFRMNPDFMDGDWRDTNIIPQYNGAGVARFAFHMPVGMPMIGQPPAPEGPAGFPTGYFGSRNDALQWLSQAGGGDP